MHRYLPSLDKVDNEPPIMAVITVSELKDVLVASLLFKYACPMQWMPYLLLVTAQSKMDHKYQVYNYPKCTQAITSTVEIAAYEVAKLIQQWIYELISDYFSTLYVITTALNE